VVFRAGDFHRDDLGGPYDVAWLSQILHGEGPEDCADLLARAVAALRPGGQLWVQEFVVEKCPTSCITVEGNEIRIETRRCAEIDVLLFDGMVDLTKPVVVTINGRRRFDRVVKPDITTLLSELVQSRDFQRLVVARIRFGIRSEAPDNAATPAPK